jgi:arsenical pump membrane protein
VIVLLIAAVVLMLGRPRGLPVWVGPVAAAALGMGLGWIDAPVRQEAIELLDQPLLFLVFAVPLALMLDHLGFFAAAAERIDGRRLVGGLWVLAAAVTALLNLDAAVVLLTPLYIRVARRRGIAPAALAFQPAMLACLASSALPVSNLTNLIAGERFDVGVADFVAHLGVPTLVACAVGWFGYRRAFATDLAAAAPPTGEPVGFVDRAALRRGAPIVALIVVGFTLGDVVGVPAWAVAAAAAAWSAILLRRLAWRAVPVEAIALAASLTLVVLGAADKLGLDRLLGRRGLSGDVAAAGYGAAASITTNNLPAVVAALPVIAERQLWPLLIAVNIAPALIVTGSLSGLLWRDTARRLGVDVGFAEYSRVGLRVGLPALFAAVALTLLLA